MKALEEYRKNLTKLVQSIDGLSEQKSNVLWVLQEPVDVDKMKLEQQIITNRQIDLYNGAAVEVTL